MARAAANSGRVRSKGRRQSERRRNGRSKSESEAVIVSSIISSSGSLVDVCRAACYVYDSVVAMGTNLLNHEISAHMFSVYIRILRGARQRTHIYRDGRRRRSSLLVVAEIYYEDSHSRDGAGRIEREERLGFG